MTRDVQLHLTMTPRLAGLRKACGFVYVDVLKEIHFTCEHTFEKKNDSIC